MTNEQFASIQRHAADHREIADEAINHAEDHKIAANRVTSAASVELVRETQAAMLLTQMATAHALLAIAEELRLMRERP